MTVTSHRSTRDDLAGAVVDGATRGRAAMYASDAADTSIPRSLSSACLVDTRSSTSIFFVLTLFLQQGRAFTPLEAGLALTPFALGSAASSAIGKRRAPEHSATVGGDLRG